MPKVGYKQTEKHKKKIGKATRNRRIKELEYKIWELKNKNIWIDLKQMGENDVR